MTIVQAITPSSRWYWATDVLDMDIYTLAPTTYEIKSIILLVCGCAKLKIFVYMFNEFHHVHCFISLCSLFLFLVTTYVVQLVYMVDSQVLFEYIRCAFVAIFPIIF